MLGLRRWLPLTLLVALFACRDMGAPSGEPQTPALLITNVMPDGPHILQQSPSAPPLETYQTSLWVRKGTEFNISVRYQPAAGQSVGDPFLHFNLPKDGLIAGAGGKALGKADSVLLTLTIDPVAFSTEFGPSGVKFSAKSPATLVMCYQNMNPDLNADGVVDDQDAALQQQISFWTQSMKADAWFKLPTKYDPANPCAQAKLYHFSYYAVSW